MTLNGIALIHVDRKEYHKAMEMFNVSLDNLIHFEAHNQLTTTISSSHSTSTKPDQNHYYNECHEGILAP